MRIDAPHNFADLQTKVDQLVMLQLSRERDVAEGHSMKALVSTLSGSCAQYCTIHLTLSSSTTHALQWDECTVP